MVDGNTPQHDAKELSKLLFEARESLTMWADVVESQSGVPDTYTRGLVDQIDVYRSRFGWNPDGYGHET